MTKQVKDWTVLLYLNGNNELLPEMWQAKAEAEKHGSTDSINVVVQVSREKEELLAILRPGRKLPTGQASWIGTRRYYLTGGKSVLIKDLGKINMADPLSLYNFISWAVNAYPAKRYMLVLGGHGYQFVGAMTDYSQALPYIMGIAEMSEAIHNATQAAGVRIDLAVLDICYFNFIEVMYELGKKADYAVDRVLTYIDDGPLAGLPYSKLLSAVQASGSGCDVRHVVARIMDSIDLDLVAVEISHDKLQHIKKLFHELACCYLVSGMPKPDNYYHLLQSAQPTDPWYTLSTSIQYGLVTIVERFKRVTKLHSDLLHCANRPTNQADRAEIYGKLDFAHNNDWAYLICGRRFNSSVQDISVTLKPTVLTPHDVASYIAVMNSNMPELQREHIFDQMVSYKRWPVVKGEWLTP